MRWLVSAFAVLLFVVIVPVFAVAWLVGTESGFRALARLVDAAAGDALSIEGVAGRLWDAPRIAHVRYAGGAAYVDAHDFAMEWNPRALLHRKFEVARIQLGTLDIATPSSKEPSRPPVDLRLPFALDAGRIQLDRLRILAWPVPGSDSPPAQPSEPVVVAELSAIAGHLVSDGRHHELREARVDTVAGRVMGDISLDGSAPFALDAALRLQGSREDKQYQVEAKASGPLESFTLDATAGGWDLQGHAALDITPFAPVPFRRAQIEAGEIDPAAFAQGAPHAALRIQADLVPQSQGAGDKSVPLSSWVLAGPVMITNRTPGPLDKSALPIVSLAARAVWQAEELALEDLKLATTGKPAGTATGRLSLREQTVSAQLAVDSLDLREFVSTLKSMRLSGQLDATAGSEEQSLRANLADKNIRADFSLTQKAGMLTLHTARLAAGKAVLDARGTLQLRANRAFELKGTLASFDPALYAQVPHATLNADLSASGALKPQALADISFVIKDSTLLTRDGSRPLSGKGDLQLSAERLAHADVTLDLAGNRLAAQGAFGKLGDRLALTLDAPQLDALGYGFGGQLTAQATLDGTPSAPGGELAANALALAIPGGLHVASLNLNGRLREGLEGRFDLALAFAGLRQGDAPALIERASVGVEGTRGAHRLVSHVELGGPDVLDLTANGALLDGPAWKGDIQGFELHKAKLQLALTAPASLAASASEVVLGEAELKSMLAPRLARLHLRETRWTPNAIVARGDLSGVQIGLGQDEAQRTNKGNSLSLGAEWDLRAADELSGKARIFRESGDITLQGDRPIDLGLRQLELVLEAQHNRITARLEAAGQVFGTLQGALSAQAERSGNDAASWRLARHAPLEGQANISMPAIAWLGKAVSPNLQLDGSLQGELQVGGTPAQPDAHGTLHGNALQVALADQGLRLTDGQLAIDFTQDRAKLSEFNFRADPRMRPREGRIDFAGLTRTPSRLTGSGEIELASGKGVLQFDADRLAVLQRTDRWLMLSGQAKVSTAAWDDVAVTSQLRADAGYFELPKSPPPALSDDVIVLGREQRESRPLRFAADLEIDLGQRLYFSGRGLDTRLTGELRLRGDSKSPLRATGSITARDGSFDAYGQSLSIERGIVNFQGPVDNAGLNVLALRKGLAVEAGVEITGTVRNPKVRLVSEPSVPDAEKLSWIVLGRGQDQSGGADSALLLSAASAILGGSSGGITRQLAQGLGVDQISVTQGDISGGRTPISTVAGTVGGSSDANLTSQIVSVGKRISSSAFLSYEQSLSGAASVVKLTYNLSRRVALIGRAGTDNSVDVLYTISFR